MERTIIILGAVLLVTSVLAENYNSRKKRNSSVQDGRLEEIAEALEEAIMYGGGGDSRRRHINGFVPRLGRGAAEEEEKRSHTGGFIPRLGRESGEELVNLGRWLQDPDFAEEFLYQRSPPFAPRLGKRALPFSPRLGRDNHRS